MSDAKVVRCAIYTRKSSEEGLEQSFNSLDAQREACEAYILSQRHEGWKVLTAKYDDGGFSGGNIERPALKRMLADVAAKRIDTVVVYKVDRLTRSLADFAKIVEQFDGQGVSFVSVTQQFNTTTSMGRLTLNVLLSFAQFEREVTGERIRDKIAASKKKGMWMGGVTPMGYDLRDHELFLHPEDAEKVREIFRIYLKEGSVSNLQIYLDQHEIRSKVRVSKTGNTTGGKAFSRGSLYELLQNRVYLGEITHKGVSYPGKQPAIIDEKLWDKVQEQLKSNIQGERRKSRPKDQSLLVGLLYDAHGNRFTPSHANKGSRRYRYYISQAVLKGRAKQDGPTRIPACEIEGLVIDRIRHLLQSPQELADIVIERMNSSAALPRLVDAAAKLTGRIDEALESVVKRAVVHRDRVEINILRSGLCRELFGDDTRQEQAEEDVTTVDLIAKASLKRHGGEMRLQLPPSDGGKSRPTQPLVRAVVRANDWLDRILKGELENGRAISKSTGFNERYVSRILPLAFLAPDLTEAILDGSLCPQLAGCSAGISLAWPAQRDQFTFFDP